MSEKTDVDYGLIKCKHDGKEEKLPWCIVCVHLVNGISREWIPLIDHQSGKPDWVCPTCEVNFYEMMERREFDCVRPICIKCVEKLREKFDPKYKKEEAHDLNGHSNS